jgi:hypothetical protein
MDENVLIEDYESGEILLATAKSEYNNEHNRTTILDSKTNIVLTFSALLFVAMTQIVNIKKRSIEKVNSTLQS